MLSLSSPGLESRLLGAKNPLLPQGHLMSHPLWVEKKPEKECSWNPYRGMDVGPLTPPIRTMLFRLDRLTINPALIFVRMSAYNRTHSIIYQSSLHQDDDIVDTPPTTSQPDLVVTEP